MSPTQAEPGTSPGDADSTESSPALLDLVQLAAGDSAEWKRFLEFSHGIVLAAAYRTGLPVDDHDELIQVTCVICFQAISKLREAASLGSWVYRIAYRQSLKIIRGRSSSPKSEEGSDWLLQRFPSGEPGEDEILEQNETALQLRQAVRVLGEPCRRLITVLYLEGESPSYEDVSERTGMPMGSIGPTRARCLDRARQSLKQVSDEGQYGSGAKP